MSKTRGEKFAEKLLIFIMLVAVLFIIAKTASADGALRNSYDFSQASGGTITIGSVVVAETTDVIVVTVEGNYGAAHATAVSCDSVALTKAISVQPTIDVPDASVWYLAEPNVGTQSCVATLNGSVASQMSVYVFTGLDQADLLDNTARDGANSAALSEPVVVSLNGGISVSAMASNNTSTPSPTDSYTGSYNGQGHGSSYYLAATAGSITMGWTHTSAPMGLALASFNPLAGGGGGATTSTTTSDYVIGDNTAQVIFYGFVLFYIAMIFIIWFFRRS